MSIDPVANIPIESVRRRDMTEEERIVGNAFKRSYNSSAAIGFRSRVSLGGAVRFVREAKLLRNQAEALSVHDRSSQKDKLRTEIPDISGQEIFGQRENIARAVDSLFDEKYEEATAKLSLRLGLDPKAAQSALVVADCARETFYNNVELVSQGLN